MPQLERPKLQRKVTFRNDETDSPEKVCASPLSETLTVETNRELWYQRDEINAFRKEVGTILLYGRISLLWMKMSFVDWRGTICSGQTRRKML